MHDLPSIHHFWANRHVLPLLEEVGVSGVDDLWRSQIAKQCQHRYPETARLVSLGAGNGDLEISLASALADEGMKNIELVLLELNAEMLDRALASADRVGLGSRVRAVQADLNTWTATEPADIYLANHSLHHLVQLEHLCEQVHSSLTEDGVLLVNDMIGRNGHVRWPEAAECIKRIWRAAPSRYRYNHSLGRVDDTYPDLDCSQESFEGIRAQDVLPLLLRSFHPEIYVTFASVIDPFVDRVYGPNFDPDDPGDTTFIDAIAKFDEAGIDAQVFSPTHLVATFRRSPVACHFPRQRSPQRTVRGLGETPPTVVGEATGPLGSEAPADLATVRASPIDAPSVVDDGWASYHALRARKAVRLALRLVDARQRLADLRGQARSSTRRSS